MTPTLPSAWESCGTLTGRMPSSENALAPQLTKIVWQNRRKTVFFKDVVDCLVLGGWREIRGLIESTQGARGAKLWRQLAAYGSSGSLEESAQDGDLEERVERHVVYARASGRVSARASGQA